MMIRATAVTTVLLACTAAVILMTGEVFTVVEKNAFGNEAQAFGIYDRDVFIIFGQQVRIPIISIMEKIGDFFHKYAPGIIKLLGFAVNGVEELINETVYKIVSSLK